MKKTTKNKIKTEICNMHISKQKLEQFILLFESRTGQKLTEKEALDKAEILLRTVSILYRPVSIKDYCNTIVKKQLLKIKK